MNKSSGSTKQRCRVVFVFAFGAILVVHLNCSPPATQVELIKLPKNTTMKACDLCSEVLDDSQLIEVVCSLAKLRTGTKEFSHLIRDAFNLPQVSIGFCL